MKNFQLLILIISIFLLSKIDNRSQLKSLKCDEEEIENCKKCGTGENSNRCAECEDNYFPFLFNYLCLPCDHMQYGDSGCQGKCYIDNYLDVTCDEFGCKDGFYSIDKKTCVNCNSFNTENCVKCSNLPPEGKTPTETDERIFKCNKCINNNYGLDSNGKCKHCLLNHPHCEKCHYLENSSISVCDRCSYDYYLKNGECVKCRRVSIYNGECRYCTDDDTDYQNIYCSCKTYYTKNSVTSCIKCPDNCNYCEYNQNLGRGECKSCFNGYILISKGLCKSCGKGCRLCSLDRNENPICSLCDLGYELKNGECYQCPPNCEICHLENDEYICDKCFALHTLDSNKNCVHCPNDCSACTFNSNGKLICTGCITGYKEYLSYYYYYYKYFSLNGESLCQICPEACNDCFWKESTPEFGCKSCRYSDDILKDDKCIKCSTVPELGEGCYYCNFNNIIQKFQCTRCLNGNYALISNMYKCIINDINSPPNLYGCLKANYNQETNIYECLNCKSGFIPILNEKSCKTYQETNLQTNCIEANNIGTKSNPIYSCVKCYNPEYPLVDIIDYRGAHDCYRRINELIFCQSGIKDEIGDLKCTKCIGYFKFIFNNIYNKEVCETCLDDSFRKNDWCYKCDDKNVGNPGCVREIGCDYYSAHDRLDCRECKVGYFEYTIGQCFQCEISDPRCTKCHFNNELDRFECDKCMDGYFINNEKICQLIVCDEHPEIMPGCVICTDKLNEYIPVKKCQSCISGFFKTKDDTCFYCKAEKNGGPACEICEYLIDEEGNETNDIRCKICSERNFLTSDGKCYNCQEELGYDCQNCELKKDENNKTEKLVCKTCYKEHNLTSNNHCIHANSFAERIPYCRYQYSYINHYIPENNNLESDIISNISNENYYIDEENIETERYEIISHCNQCKDGYFKYGENQCQSLDVTNCSLLFLFSNFENRNENGNNYFDVYNHCSSICSNTKYVQIHYYYEENEEVNITTNILNETDQNLLNETHIEIRTIKNQFSIGDYFKSPNNYEINNKIMNIIVKGHLCLFNSGKGDKLSPINLRKCRNAEYTESNDTYTCLSCVEGYLLDTETNTCKQSIKVKMNLRPGFDNCYVTNIGTNLNPIYSCKSCYNADYILATSDTGANFCVPKVGELEGCTSASVNTTYLYNVYNCTSCIDSYIPYYNIFFDKKICQNIRQIPDKKRELDSTAFIDVEYVDAIDGICENNKLFSPDGKKCYACNNRTVGMVGCKGACTFNLKKNISLKCEDDKCKTGFIEKISGVCEPCETVNEGCIECHYENDYLKGYYGLKRKRRFSCDQCDTGYLRSEDGTCHHCSTLGFYNCRNCNNDIEHDNELICVECNPGYFINSEGKCIQCYSNEIRSKNNNCITCDDVEEGGIEGCESCFNENNEPKCISCKNGFILEEGGKKCLRISSNVELEELIHCKKTTLISNHYICTECEGKFVLVKEKNYIKCIHESYIPVFNPYNCEVFINLGTEDQPKYSCSKCITSIDINSGVYSYFYSRITFKENNTAYCEYNQQHNTQYSSLENCTEAIMTIENGVKKINCTECIEENILFYHADTDLNICKYKYFEKQCVVKYCKKCIPGNNYFCQECLPSDYEVSPLTGGCILKVDRAPAVHFEDIFRLQFNQQKQIGGRSLKGPFLSLRGLTNSQINTGHAFLVFLSFKLHYTKNSNRNLEEEKTVKTYCQIVESMDYTTDETNMVDYDCIGDTEEEDDFSDYELNSIKESTENNEGIFENSNLDELAEETDLKNLQFKHKTSYELKDFVKLTTFILDEVPTFTSEDYHFEFTLNGKINRNLPKMSFDAKLSVSQIKNKSFICIFNVKEEKQADLNCDIDFEEYKNEFSEFSFKATTIKHDDDSFFLTRINEVRLVHEEKEKKNIIIFIIIAIIAVLVIAGIIFGICLYKKKKKLKNGENNPNHSQNSNNIIIPKNKNDINQVMTYRSKGYESKEKAII